MDESVNNDKGYIDDDIESRPFFWFGVIFVAFSVLSVVAVTYVYKGLSAYHDRSQAEAPTRVVTGKIVPPGTPLQANPVTDMVAMDEAQSELLSSYGWVDKEKGIARIPIEDAIAMTIERSLVRAQEPDASSAPEAIQAESGR